jgi:septum formation protein
VASRELVLASRSPQRHAILTQLGIAHRVVVSEAQERTGGDPRALVLENALRKARAVPGSLVLGADTAVAVDGQALGKPRDAAQARSFLAILSGREHEVWSGLALRDAGGRERTVADVTRVRFRALTDGQLDWYLDTGEWRERAGGYAIQGRGAALVERVEGDFWTVVGLPVAALLRIAPELLWSQAPDVQAFPHLSRM